MKSIFLGNITNEFLFVVLQATSREIREEHEALYLRLEI